MGKVGMTRTEVDGPLVFLSLVKIVLLSAGLCVHSTSLG